MVTLPTMTNPPYDHSLESAVAANGSETIPLVVVAPLGTGTAAPLEVP